MRKTQLEQELNAAVLENGALSRRLASARAQNKELKEQLQVKAVRGIAKASVSSLAYVLAGKEVESTQGEPLATAAKQLQRAAEYYLKAVGRA